MESKGQNTADFINVTLWGKTAEFAANYLGKGKMVGVQGRIQTGNYDDKDGKKIYTTEVVANNIEILEWGNKEDNGIEGFKEVSNDHLPF